MCLADVKVGDYIAVWGQGFYPTLERRQVTRATKATVEAGGYTFNRHGRIRGGSSYSHVHAEPWEPEHDKQFAELRDQARQRKIANELRAYPYRNLTLEQLEQVYALLPKVETK